MSRLRDEYEPEILDRQSWDDSLDATFARAQMARDEAERAAGNRIDESTLQPTNLSRRRNVSGPRVRRRKKSSGMPGRPMKGDERRTERADSVVTPSTAKIMATIKRDAGITTGDLLEINARIIQKHGLKALFDLEIDVAIVADESM